MMKNPLQYWRQESRLTQIELAALSGVPRYLIQLAESGQRVLGKESLLRLEEALGLPIGTLRKVMPVVGLLSEGDSQ